MAARTMTGWPFVTPPSRPPALLERRSKPPASSKRISSWTWEPGRRAAPQPMPRSGALAPGAPGGREAQADLAAFDGVNGAEGSGEPAVELAVPLHVRAQADRAVEGHHLEDATQRIAGRLRLVDGLDHGALGGGIGAADFGCFRACPDLVPRAFQGTGG